VIEDPVVSMAALEGRLSSAARLEVRRDAVVTPAVLDELRARGIPLCRGAATDPEASAAGRLYVAVGMVDDVPAAGKCLEDAAIGPAEWEHFRCPETAVKKACEAAARDRRAVLFTDRVAAAVCRANRDPKVRAACGWDVRAVREALSSMPVNLLVVDPRRHGLFALRALLRTYSSEDIHRRETPCASLLSSERSR
jgi:hypothetical protein